MVYGVCASCGHGVLLAPEPDQTIHSENAYYEKQAADGAGYRNYANERSYREGKAKRLLRWASANGCREPGKFVEIGSGFGFTRKAAEDLGWTTQGVDLNPSARKAACELYGFETVTGDLHSALAGGAVRAAEYDLVLYQFVLEHVPDPGAELRSAASLLSPRGYVLILVPGMDAVERTIFGSSYRSLRSDHLHLFSRRSIRQALQRAGLRLARSFTECSVHLLAPFLTQEELANLYKRGEGPDMVILAEKEDRNAIPIHRATEPLGAAG